MTANERRFILADVLILVAIVGSLLGLSASPVGFWAGAAMLTVAFLLLRPWVRCRVRRPRRWRCSRRC